MKLNTKQNSLSYITIGQLYALFTTVGCFDHWGYNGFEKVGKTTSDETVNYCGGGKQKGGKSRPSRRMFDF